VQGRTEQINLMCLVYRKSLRAIGGPDKLSLPVLSAVGSYKTEYPEPRRRTTLR